MLERALFPGKGQGSGGCDLRCDTALRHPGSRYSARAMAKQAQSIEDHFAAIEQAIAALDAGDLPLEDSLSRYESGLKAVRLARGLLDKYAARLEELRGDGEPPAGA